jgi:hypothetical protein
MKVRSEAPQTGIDTRRILQYSSQRDRGSESRSDLLQLAFASERLVEIQNYRQEYAGHRLDICIIIACLKNSRNVGFGSTL